MDKLTTKIITAETFRNHQGFDLATLEDKTMPASKLVTFRVYEQELFQDFKLRLAQKLRYSPNQFRFWLLEKRHNGTMRPDTVVPENDSQLTMGGVRSGCSKNRLYGHYSTTGDLILYLELLDPLREALSSASREAQQMIFVKHFDASNQKLAGIGHFYVDCSGGLAQISGLIKTRMNFPVDTHLNLYEEIQPGCIRKNDNAYYHHDMKDGDIICFQVELSDQKLAELQRQKLCVDAVGFYDLSKNLVLLHFKPRHHAMATTIEFSLILSETWTYDQMAKQVSDRLNHEPQMLRFTTSHQGNPQDVIHREGNLVNRNSIYAYGRQEETVAGMIKSQHNDDKPNNILFYELLDLPTGEAQPKRIVKVTWTGAYHREEGKYSLLMSTTSSMQDVADKLSTMVKFTKNSSQKIKLFTTQHGQIGRTFTGQEILKDVPDLEDIYAAEVSALTLKQYDPAAMLKMLEFVTKLNADGSNYQQWLRALESVLGMATGKVKLLTSSGHTISDAEDLMIKQAITASVDDALFVTVLEAESGMAAFVEMQKRYTFHSRSGHIAIMKEILETKFNLDDRTAEIASHFRRVQALAEKLFASGFELGNESLIGLLFQLSLPKLDAEPFVNLCRRIDERPGGASNVSNEELVQIAEVELSHFRQLRQNTSRGPSVLLMQAPMKSRESESVDMIENQAMTDPAKDQGNKVTLVRRRSFPLTGRSNHEEVVIVGAWSIER